MTATIPGSHKNLLKDPICAALTTVMPDGQPQTTVVWCNYDGKHVLINTMRGFRKEKNMRINPKVTLLVFNPQNPLRYIEVRGEVQLTDEGAMEHLNELSQLYTGKSQYFGEVVPLDLKERETPVKGIITPKRVIIDPT